MTNFCAFRRMRGGTQGEASRAQLPFWAVALAVAALCIPGPVSAQGKHACGNVKACSAACDAGDDAACIELVAQLVVLCEKKGVAKACTLAGALYTEGKYVERSQEAAARLYRRGCELGEGGSCNDWGVALVYGYGVPVDESAGIAAWEKACELGEGIGCLNFGGRLREGRGIKRDAPRAVSVLGKGCDLGRGAACYQLAQMQEAAEGTQKDAKAALRNFEKACDLGEMLGCMMALDRGGDGQGPRTWEDYFSEVKERCKKLDESLACSQLAQLYRFGRGTKKDTKTALGLHQHACDARYAPSCEYAGNMIAGGEAGAAKWSAAEPWYEKGCKASALGACRTLGEHYFKDGKAKKKSLVKAASWFQLGCDGNDAPSCRYLGKMTQAGQGVPKDDARGTQLLEKACALGDDVACQP